jgi:hypothetical protein
MMGFRCFFSLFLIAWCLLPTSPCFAARPLNTDDANIVDENGCQLETWTKRQVAASSQWAMPACNWGRDVEWTLGAARLADDAVGANQWRAFQAKKRWQSLADHGLGIASAVGVVRTYPNSPSHDYFLNLPVSVSLERERYIHLNAGFIVHHATSQTHATWGVGAELPVTPSWIAIAETYGETQQNTAYQMGLRFWAVPQKVQIDTTYGNQFGTPVGQRWLTVGLRLMFSPH